MILVGDVLEKIREIPDESVDCVVSSPPYWGLRDYGEKGQWGLEPDFSQYLQKLSCLMDQVRRVLKKTGTVWINLGDTYLQKKCGNLARKSRAGIPWRFYIDCIDKGWIARNEIVWYKNNAMPASVKDRLQNRWEPVLFFAKSAEYYFNLDAIREPSKTNRKPFNVRVRDSHKGRFLQKATVAELQAHNSKGEKKGTAQGFKGKNPGDVFFINVHPFRGAHFATFPPALPEKILRCACPPGGVVLDPFFGAGTTGVAAQKLGLNWIGIELKAEYAEMARRRIELYKHQNSYIVI